ncbi:Uncharacterised protein [Mycobacterium tuberculosis]|nr:Uncharacterised protein [Mycobacterium tuberculosis]
MSPASGPAGLTATPVGVLPTLMVLMTWLVCGSITDTVSLPELVT